MGVEIDKPGRHHQAARIDHSFTAVRGDLPHVRDDTVLDGDVATITRQARTVDDESVFYDEIEFGHNPPLDCRYVLEPSIHRPGVRTEVRAPPLQSGANSSTV